MALTIRQFECGFNVRNGRYFVGRWAFYLPNGGMAPSVSVVQLLDGEFGLDGGGVEFLVTEQLLDEPDIGSVLQHLGRATEVSSARFLPSVIPDLSTTHPARIPQRPI